MNPSALVLIAQKIAYANDRIDLVRGEPRKQVPPDRLCANGKCSSQLLAADLGERDESCPPIARSTLKELPFLHSAQLVRQAALFPPHHGSEFLLAHLTFAKCCKAGEYSKLRTGKSGCLCDVASHAFKHVLAHGQERMPNAKFARGQRFCGHRFEPTNLWLT